MQSTQAITAAGNYRFSVPRGASFSVAVSGTIGTCTIQVQYITLVGSTETLVNYTTSTDTLINVLGELFLVNVGSVHEISVNVSATTNIVVVVNPAQPGRVV